MNAKTANDMATVHEVVEELARETKRAHWHKGEAA